MAEYQQFQQSKESKPTFQKQTTPIVKTLISNPASIIQRARINPKSLTSTDILQLQHTIGNIAVGRLFSGISSPSTAQQAPVQRQKIPEEEKPLQGKGIETIQRQKIPEEEKPLQSVFETEPEKATCPSCIQRQKILEKEETLQGKMIGTIQRQEISEEEEPLQKKSENNTGMPDNLKAGVENLSGIDMSDVRVHYNSDKPAELGALAYTQGTNIHVAPGQERHLPHEAWHVVQQVEGRVKPTMQMKGLQINYDKDLEREADVMGSAGNQKEIVIPNNVHERHIVREKTQLEKTVQCSFIGFLGGGVVGLGLSGLLYLTGVPGGLALLGSGLLGSLGGLIGHYETEKTAVVPPQISEEEGNETNIELYYSPSMLGHYTIILKSDSEIRRIHMVMKEESGQWMLMRKIKQVTGFARGQILSDAIDKAKYEKEYSKKEDSKKEDSKKELIGTWKRPVAAANKIINLAEESSSVKSPFYGYIIYTKSVDNCGSFAIKALAQAGIEVTLPRWKTWLQLPTLIKGDMKKVKTE